RSQMHMHSQRLRGPRVVVRGACESGFRCACSRIRQTQSRWVVQTWRSDKSEEQLRRTRQCFVQAERIELKSSCYTLLFFLLRVANRFAVEIKQISQDGFRRGPSSCATPANVPGPSRLRLDDQPVFDAVDESEWMIRWQLNRRHSCYKAMRFA